MIIVKGIPLSFFRSRSTRKGFYFPESGLKEISTANLNAAAENARRF